MPPGLNRSAGFSLVEVLVALTIAVLLTAVLTRVISNTRMNASKIRELVQMMTLSDSVLEKVSRQSPETTSGRSGPLAWHIQVSPMAMSAVAHIVNIKTPTADQSVAKASGATLPAMSAPDTESSDNGPASANGSASAPKDPVQWIPLHVTIVVESSSGRKYVTDTASIGLVPAKQ
jgi:prepilin-type N-terminal cleavage/methylation domain-containing protein